MMTLENSYGMVRCNITLLTAYQINLANTSVKTCQIIAYFFACLLNKMWLSPEQDGMTNASVIASLNKTP